jgi:hypothetical protein
VQQIEMSVALFFWVKGTTENSHYHLIVVEFYTSSFVPHVVNHASLQIHRLKFNNFDLTSRAFDDALNRFSSKKILKIGVLSNPQERHRFFTKTWAIPTLSFATFLHFGHI